MSDMQVILKRQGVLRYRNNSMMCLLRLTILRFRLRLRGAVLGCYMTD